MEGIDCKVAICGASNSGKSCLCSWFMQAYFSEEHDPTIEDKYKKQLKIEEQVVVLDILDTAGFFSSYFQLQ